VSIAGSWNYKARNDTDLVSGLLASPAMKPGRLRRDTGAMNRTLGKGSFAAKPYQNTSRSGINSFGKTTPTRTSVWAFKETETGCEDDSLRKGKNAPNKSLPASGVIRTTVRDTAR